jgi:hypothetical protein
MRSDNPTAICGLKGISMSFHSSQMDISLPNAKMDISLANAKGATSTVVRKDAR